MIETTVLNFLSGKLRVPVLAEVPRSPPGSFAVVEKTGGGRSTGLKQATVAVQSYGETLLPIESVFDRGGVWYHAKGLDALSLDDTQLEDRCKTIPRAEAEQLMERYTKQYEALPFTPFKA